MREQKVHKFWIEKGKTKDQQIQEFFNTKGYYPSEEEKQEIPDEIITYDGVMSVLSIELDSFLTSIYDGTSEIIKFKYLGYEYEEIYTKEDVDEIVEEETEKLKERIDNINGFLDNVSSHLDDLKSSMSDLDYYVDEAIEDLEYAQCEIEETNVTKSTRR